MSRVHNSSTPQIAHVAKSKTETQTIQLSNRYREYSINTANYD